MAAPLYHLSRGNGENDNPDIEESKVSGAGNDRKADSPKTKKYKEAQREILGQSKGHRVLGFKEKAVVPIEQQQQRSVLYSQNRAEAGRRVARSRVTRKIASQPERILDAPDLKDDYYLNLIDWSAQNVLAVALGPTVYLWNATDGSINELLTLENEEVDYVSSLSWVPGDGNFLAVGGSIQLSNCGMLTRARSSVVWLAIRRGYLACRGTNTFFQVDHETTQLLIMMFAYETT